MPVLISLVNDTVDEDSESLTARLRLESVGISVQVAPDETVVVIVDDDGKCD